MSLFAELECACMLSVTAGAVTEFPANHPCELRVSPLFFFGVKGLCGSSEITDDIGYPVE